MAALTSGWLGEASDEPAAQASDETAAEAEETADDSTSDAAGVPEAKD